MCRVGHEWKGDKCTVARGAICVTGQQERLSKVRWSPCLYIQSVAPDSGRSRELRLCSHPDLEGYVPLHFVPPSREETRLEKRTARAAYVPEDISSEGWNNQFQASFPSKRRPPAWTNQYQDSFSKRPVTQSRISRGEGSEVVFPVALGTSTGPPSGSLARPAIQDGCSTPQSKHPDMNFEQEPHNLISNAGTPLHRHDLNISSGFTKAHVASPSASGASCGSLAHTTNTTSSTILTHSGSGTGDSVRGDESSTSSPRELSIKARMALERLMD